jgi:hypothetical protein
MQSYSEIDVLAFAAGRTPHQGRADRRHAVQAGIHVGDRNPQQRWWFARIAKLRHRAGFCFRDQAEAGFRRIRPGMPIGRDRAIDQARIELGKLGIAEAEFFQRAEAVILDKDVGGLDQFVHQNKPAAAVRKAAPSVTLEAARIDEVMPQALQSGEADLALGLIPSLETGFYQQTLFRQDFVCLTGPRHPRVKASLSLAQYQAEEHIGIVSGTGQQLLEEAVEKFGIERRVVLRLPGFLGLTAIVATSDLVVTLPRHIGETLAALGGLRVHACPFPIPPFFVKQHWHARYHHDTANRWLRGLCATLFLKKQGKFVAADKRT